MKKKIVLDFYSNPADLWIAYIDYLSDYFEREMKGIALVHCEINSIKDSGVINIGEIDHIVLSDGLAEEISKKIFISFNVFSSLSGERSKIQFEFLSGLVDDENFEFIEVSKIFFDPKILFDPKLITQFKKFLNFDKSSNGLEPRYFSGHKLAYLPYF